MSEIESPRDPFSDMVTSAFGLHEWFESLLKAGFTDDQAIRLIGYTLGNAIYLKGRDESEGQ